MLPPTLENVGHLRLRVLLTASFSRLLCLLLTFVWPKIFPTYNSQSTLLHIRAPRRQDYICNSLLAFRSNKEHLIDFLVNLQSFYGVNESPLGSVADDAGETHRNLRFNVNNVRNKEALSSSHSRITALGDSWASQITSLLTGDSNQKSMVYDNGRGKEPHSADAHITKAHFVPVLLRVDKFAFGNITSSASLSDAAVQIFLEEAEPRCLKSSLLPVTARQPWAAPCTKLLAPDNQITAHSVSKKTYHAKNNHNVISSIEDVESIQKLASQTRNRDPYQAGASRASRIAGEELDAWVWTLVQPLLSWDGEYFISNAMQGSAYFFEMTHAFFPGISMVYIVAVQICKNISACLVAMFKIVYSTFAGNFCVKAYNQTFETYSHFSDGTLIAVVAVVLSNIGFLLATLGVFEFSRILLCIKSIEHSCCDFSKKHWRVKATTEENASHSATTDSTVAERRASCFSISGHSFENGSAKPSQCTYDSLYSGSLLSSEEFRISYANVQTGSLQEVSGRVRSRLIERGSFGLTKKEEEASTVFCPEGVKTDFNQSSSSCISQRRSDNKCRRTKWIEDYDHRNRLAFWAAIWYIFSGASIHLSAAYTDSVFALLSIWGLVFLFQSMQKEYIWHSSYWMPSSFEAELYTTPNKHEVTRKVHILSNEKSNSITKVKSESRKTFWAVTWGLLTNKYSCGWASTALLSSAAFLRSNGSLALIPLFAYTLHTSPLLGRFSQFFNRVVYRKCECVTKKDSVRQTGVLDRTMRLAFAFVVHWVNALGQAIMVITPIIIVLAYPFYLYCACPPATLFSASLPCTKPHTLKNQSQCQLVADFLGQRASEEAALFDSPLLPEDLSPEKCRVLYGSTSCRRVSFSPSTNFSLLQQLPHPLSFSAFADSLIRVGLIHPLSSFFPSTSTLLRKYSEFGDRSSTMSAGTPSSNLWGFSIRRKIFFPGARDWGTQKKSRKLIKADKKKSAWEFYFFAYCYEYIVGAANARPLWCNRLVPNIYTSIQNEYWNVSFLTFFFGFRKMYLVLITLPLYIVGFSCVIFFIMHCLPCKSSIKLHQIHLREQSLQNGKCPKQRLIHKLLSARGVSAFREQLACWLTQLYAMALNEESGVVLSLLALMFTMLFFAHANVFVRLSTACPIYFLHMARMHVAYTQYLSLAGKRQNQLTETAALMKRHHGCKQEAAIKNETLTPSSSGAKVHSSCLAVSFHRRTVIQTEFLYGWQWWECICACVLMHHFLGPLLFSCYITWT